VTKCGQNKQPKCFDHSSPKQQGKATLKSTKKEWNAFKVFGNLFKTSSSGLATTPKGKQMKKNT